MLDKFNKITEEIKNNKESISKISKLSRAFKKLNMKDYYLTKFYKESNTRTNIGNNIEKILSPNLINKIKTYEDLNEELNRGTSGLQMSDMRKKFLNTLIDWKRRKISDINEKKFKYEISFFVQK